LKTLELYIQGEHKRNLLFKNGTEKNAAYLELHTYTNRYKKHLRVLFQMTRVIVVVARFRQMPLILKMATPQQRSWCVLLLANKESVTAVQRAFRTQFHMKPPSRVSIYAW
jgi:hypothetical protein